MGMTYPDYDWEGLSVRTEDDYILTTFHVWKQSAIDDDDQVMDSKAPVFF